MECISHGFTFIISLSSEVKILVYFETLEILEQVNREKLSCLIGGVAILLQWVGEGEEGLSWLKQKSE